MRVMLVEDSAIYRKMIARYLNEWGYEVIIATDGLNAWRVLQNADPPKLLVADWLLPGMDGVDLCRKLRQSVSNDSYVYTILLTGKCKREDLLEAMAAGADDYLTKPFDELELQARLRVGERIVDLQQELVAAREDMRHSATHDGLTGLMNRKEVIAFLGRELARAKRERTSCGVIMADVDHFKKINDSFGHPFGDEVLKEVARRLAVSLRVYDGAGRYGGEEFVLVLPRCETESAVRRADDIRKIICTEPVVKSGCQATVTISMGVTAAASTGASQLDVLLQRADRALYAAKAAGRNRVEHLDHETSCGVSVREPR